MKSIPDEGRGQKAIANRPPLTTRTIGNWNTKNCFAYAKGPYRMVTYFINKDSIIVKKKRRAILIDLIHKEFSFIFFESIFK